MKIFGRKIGFPKRAYFKTTGFIKKRPFTAFLVSLAILLVIFTSNSILFKPRTEAPKQPAVKSVRVYRIGSVPTITVQGQVDKEGVIKIMAQSPGVVSSINVSEGDSVAKGSNLISLSSN